MKFGTSLSLPKALGDSCGRTTGPSREKWTCFAIRMATRIMEYVTVYTHVKRGGGVDVASERGGGLERAGGGRGGREREREGERDHGREATTFPIVMAKLPVITRAPCPHITIRGDQCRVPLTASDMLRTRES